jgi:hypothetical protein
MASAAPRHTRVSSVLRPRARARAALLAVLAVAGAVAASALVEGTKSAAPVAAPLLVRVAPTGDDRCSRGTGSVPCRTLNRAYAVARPGDTVLVAPGTYPPQQIFRGSQSQRGPSVITFRCRVPHTCTIVGDLTLGANNGSESGNPPSYVAFDGLDVKNGTISGTHNQNTPSPTHITFRNGHVYAWGDRGSLILFSDVDRFTLRNYEIGPGCCGGGTGGDGIELGVLRPGSNNSRVLFDRIDVHDLYDTCRAATPRILARYGACSGTGNGDRPRSGDHVDGLQIYGARGFTMIDSRVSNIGASGSATGQGLFMQQANGGTFANVLIENNFFGAVAPGNNNVSMSGPCSSSGLDRCGSWTGYLHVFYNTIQGNLRLYGDGESGIFAAGTPIVVAGNIIGSLASSHGNSCSIVVSDGSTYTPTYAHNLNGNRRCGPTDLVGKPTYVDPDPSAPDLHLRPGSRGLARGSVALHPATDIDGRRRPVRWPPDVGAAQLETALVVPGKAIGAARLGMDAATLARLHGRPRSVRRGAAPLSSVASYRARGGGLEVGFDRAGRAVRLTTSSRYYATAGGVGPGATLPATRFRKALCAGRKTLVARAPGLVLEARTVGRDATVVRLSVAARGFGACAGR